MTFPSPPDPVGILHQAADLIALRGAQADADYLARSTDNTCPACSYPSNIEDALGGPSGAFAGLLTPTAANTMAAMFRAWATLGDNAIRKNPGGLQTLQLAQELLDAGAVLARQDHVYR